MTPQPVYTLIFAPETIEHLAAIEPRHYSLIRETIEEQLSHTPSLPTRNRKPLKKPGPFGARWEVRFGPYLQFRVFYRVIEDEMTVRVLAIGVKRRDRLYFGNEEFNL